MAAVACDAANYRKMVLNFAVFKGEDVKQDEAVTAHGEMLTKLAWGWWKVDMRLHGKENSNSHGARPV